MRYSTGTVSIDIGSVSLTGVGTKWLANVPQTKGWIFRIAGEKDFYSVLDVTGDTAITLGEPYAGTVNQNGASYLISCDYTYFFDLLSLQGTFGCKRQKPNAKDHQAKAIDQQNRIKDFYPILSLV